MCKVICKQITRDKFLGREDKRIVRDMSFDFTIAIVPNNTSLERELNYIKSALLYASKICEL